MPLEKAIAQDSFGGGMFRGVARHLIPESGAYDLLNFLLDDEDGSPYKRGGSTYLSAADSLSDMGAVGIWDGRTVAGDRTFLISSQAAAGDLPLIVAADDATLTRLAAISNLYYPKFTENDGVVVVTAADPSAPNSYVYGGSRKSTNYTTGTVTVTAGSTSVTGAGTAWLANADKGMIFRTNTAHWNVVESVNSDTSITLRYPWGGSTAAGVAYALNPFREQPSTTPGLAACGEFVIGRLCGVKFNDPNRMIFTGFLSTGEPNLGLFAATDYHTFPGRIVGIHALRETALVFTTAGLFAVRNMAFDLTDAAGNPQQTVEKLDGMVLWGQQGVQAWQNALIVPARDGVYLVDGVSRPALLSASVNELYRSYVQAGYRPGQAFVFRNTYVLPILGPLASLLPVQGWLTCKLDGSDGRFWPWTRFSAGAVRCATVRNRADSEPKLLGGGSASGARLADLKWFDPVGVYGNDVDGTAPTFTLETRDYPTGSGQENTVRKARVRYQLVAADAPNPAPAMSFSYADEDGSFTTHPDTAAPANPGSETWLFSKRGRFVRFRLSCATIADSAVIRSVEAWVRGANRD